MLCEKRCMVMNVRGRGYKWKCLQDNARAGEMQSILTCEVGKFFFFCLRESFSSLGDRRNDLMLRHKKSRVESK